MGTSHDKTYGDKHSPGQDYLVFRLAGTEYGVALESVQEVCGIDRVEGASTACEAFAGSLKLPAGDVSVHLLHARLACAPERSEALEDVVILHSDAGPLGIAVESVVDVATVEPGQIRWSAQDDAVRDDLTLGVATQETRSIFLLDTKPLLRQLSQASRTRYVA